MVTEEVSALLDEDGIDPGGLTRTVKALPHTSKHFLMYWKVWGPGHNVNGMEYGVNVVLF